MSKENSQYKAVVIGTSAGGLNALTYILKSLPYDFPCPIIIVQHRSKDQKFLLEQVLQHKCQITIKQADEKEKINPGTIYIAPPDYHLLVEGDKTFSLSADDYVKFSRPSIDVLFETASEVYKSNLVGIILTGANDDGTDGIKSIVSHGGHTIAQDPAEAQFPQMPIAAIRSNYIKEIMSLKGITEFLLTKCCK